MKETTIVIPHWQERSGSETKIKWIELKNGSCQKKRNLLDFFKYRDQCRSYQGKLNSYSMILELFSRSSNAVGLFATYDRNYSYLEAKGDVDAKMPTKDDLFSVAGFLLGMPVTREKLEKMLAVNNLTSLFASGMPEVFYYETWFVSRYETKLQKPFEEFILEESRKMFLNCVTIKTTQTISTQRTLLCNANPFTIL